MSPLELITAHPWRRAAFTTYALSLAFFEAVVLDALVRGGSREALILADVEGVRGALSEHGARGAGRDYEVEPIKVERGVFHPKVTALSGEDQDHLLVGSGNLTFGGWGANFEVVEHLHPSFAADAFDDAADFFENIASSASLRHAATDQCASIAEGLRAAGTRGQRTGAIRLVHSLDGAISDQLIEFAAELGGASRLVVASPFWDGGSALDRLCSGLGLDEAFVHAHSGDAVQGTAGSNWPLAAKHKVNAVCIDAFDDDDNRRLHAKVFEIVCRRGRVVMSGSANATSAALGAGNNVEACVVRIQRERVVGWTYTASNPLAHAVLADETAENTTENNGILRATLDGDCITGLVLSPRLFGPARAWLLGPEGAGPLPETAIDGEGRFIVDAPNLEVHSWRSGRLIIRVQVADGRLAEGFVSLAAFTHVTRRAGAMAPRLLAMLAGTETPADVAAIMLWLQEDPGRLSLSAPVTSGGASARGQGPSLDATVALSELESRSSPFRPEITGDGDVGGASWKRFMSHILAAFREPRGPMAGTESRTPDDDDDDGAPPPDARPPDPAIQRSFANFEAILDEWIAPKLAAQLGAVLFAMAIYMCDRLSPEAGQARAWFDRLLDKLPRTSTTDDLRNDIAAVALLVMSIEGTPQGVRQARNRMLHFGVDLSSDPPSENTIPGPRSILSPDASYTDLWREVQSVRTLREQVLSYLDDFADGLASRTYPDIAIACHEEWPVLAEALMSERARRNVLIVAPGRESCPKCSRALPVAEIYKLRQHYVATARNCCGRVLAVGRP